MADDCVSKKIAKLISEGYEQDQAAAIAYSMCEAKNRGVSYVTLSEDESGWVLYGTLKLAADTYAELEDQWMSELQDDANGGHNVADLMRAVPEKYAHIDFKPTKAMADNARRALEVRAEKPDSEKGMTPVGIARARDISNRKNLSPDTVRRMKAYFDRHEIDKKGETWDEQGKGWQAWNGWGGDEGYSWSRQRVESMDAADENERTSAVRSAAPRTRYWNPAPLRVDDLNEVEGVISGYVFIWGDTDHRDSYGTYFDRERPVNLAIENGAHRRPITYEHNFEAITDKQPIGYIDSVAYDTNGLRFVGTLDRSSHFFAQIVDGIRRGVLHTSSATGEHTAEFYEDGAFKTWYLLELALTESPAESRIPAVTLVRSDSDTQADRSDPRATETNVKATPFVEPDPAGEMQPEQFVPEIDQPVSGQRSNPMELNEIVQQMLNEGKTPEEILAALVAGGMTEEEAKAFLASLMPQEAAAEAAPEGESMLARAIRERREAQLREEVAGLRLDVAQLRSAMQSAPPIKPEPVRRASGTNSNVNYNRIPDSKTRNLSASDMWFVQQALGAQGKPVSADFTRSMYAKSVDAFTQPAKNGDEFAHEFVRRFGGTRANEIMATDIAGQGTEWVGVAYATDLWEKIRIAPIYSQLVSMGMMEMSLGQGQNSIYVPTEGADPTWYSAPEANDLSSGRIEVTSNPQFVGTGRVQVTPGTLKATVAWSEELDEDSLIPMAAWLNTQMARSAAEVAEYALINGDTVVTVNTNLNLIDGTPGTGASRPAYLATNGMLKLPIITTTSLSYDAGNTHTEDTYLEVLKKLPNEVNGNVNDVVFILGVREHFAALNVPAFKTRDVNAQATVEEGVLTRVFGRRVLMSGQIALANSAGKIPAAGGTLGRILAVVPRYWAVVNKREVRFKLSEDPYNDAQLLRVSFRMGATYRSTTSAAAAAYEVAV